MPRPESKPDDSNGTPQQCSTCGHGQWEAFNIVCNGDPHDPLEKGCGKWKSKYDSKELT